MKKTKRVMSIVLAVLMLICAVPVMEADAATFSPRLTAPERTGYYGTQNSYNPFWTNSSAGNGNCTWYAWGRAYELLGSRPQLSTGNANTWYPRNQSNGAYPYGSTPKLGAIACWATGSAGHVAVVEAINDDGTFTISESSWSATSWWFRINTIRTSYYSSFQGFIYIGDFSNVPIAAPSWATITVDYNSIPVGNNINFIFNSERATGYTIGINKGSTRVLTQDIRSNQFSYNCTIKGDYSAYVTAWNESGHVDSQEVYFSVYDSKPSSSSIQSNTKALRVGNTIWFEFDSDTAVGYTIGIDKNGGRVLTQDVREREFSYNCASVGIYSAYVTAWNNFGLTDSQRVYWTVYDSKPTISTITASHELLPINQTITFSFESDTAIGYTIGIDRNGSRILTQDIREEEFSYTCSSLGDFSAYVTAWNEIGIKDSNRVNWTVYDPNHIHAYTSSVTTPATCIATGVKTYTCTVCNATKTETISINVNHHVNTKNIAATPSTCTVKGYTAGVYCNDCKKYISGHTEQALSAHQTTTVNVKNATYDAECYTGDTYCSVCKQTLSYGTVIPKLVKPDEPTNPTNPTQPTNPAPQPQQSGSCRYCGGTHTGFPGVLIGFFHSILALFGLRK